MDRTRERLDMTSLPGAESRRSFMINDILGEQTSTTCFTTTTTTASTTSTTSIAAISSNPTPYVLDDGDSTLSEATCRPSRCPPDSRKDPDESVSDLSRMKRSSDDAERTRNKMPYYDERSDIEDDEADAMEGSSNQRGGSKQPRKTRTIFTEQQLSSLELSFEHRKYLGIKDRLDLASRLRLSDAQVKTWYQNRRTKWKRETAGSYKMAPSQDNMAFLYRLLQGHQNSAPLTRPKVIFGHEICAPEAHFNFPPISACVYPSGEEVVHPIRPLLPPLLLIRDLNIPSS